MVKKSFAQEESRSLSNNIKWRIIKNFEKGIPNDRFRIYGYKWQGDTLVIIPEEAKIVKRIYSEYLSGKSRTQIEKMFAKESLTTRAGYKWVDSNIRSILTNIHYTGNLLFQKEYKVDPISKKTRKNRGELPQYFVENTHEAIISMEDFEKVQEEMKRRHDAGAKGNPAINTTVLTGKVKCLVCQRNFYSGVRSQKNGRVKVWFCSNRKEGKKSHCYTGEMHDSILKEIICEVLGTKEFDEELFEREIEHIDVVKKEKLIFHFKDGKQVEHPYVQKKHISNYTKEEWEVLTKRWRNKHLCKRSTENS